MISILIGLLSTVSESKLQEYSWNLTSLIDAPDGYSRWVVGINNKPCSETSIIVLLGDTIKVTVNNQLEEAAAIHWHGILQEGSVVMDGAVGVTQCEIPPGGTYVYEYTPSHAGTFWYHSHYRDQYVDGLRGALVIIDPNDPHKYLYDEEKIITVGDWYHNQSSILAKSFMNPDSYLQTNEPVWSSGIINGCGQYNCSDLSEGVDFMSCTPNEPFIFNFTYGTRYRLRIINTAAFCAFNFSIANHGMRIIEADGFSTVVSDVITNLFINVGERYSVVVIADQQIGSYLMVAETPIDSPYTSLPSNQVDPGFPGFVYALVSYEFEEQKVKVQNYPEVYFDESNVFPLVNDVPSQSTRVIKFEFQFEIYSTDNGNYARMTINDATTTSTYRPQTVPTLFDILYNKISTSDLPLSANAVHLNYGEVVDFVIINYDGGEHPFHVHGHFFWVIARGNAANYSEIPTQFDLSQALKRDTITVDECVLDNNGDCQFFGYAVLRILANNPGVWLFHCHIDWHMMMGLAMTLVEAPELINSQKNLNTYCCNNSVLDSLHYSLIQIGISTWINPGLALLALFIQ